MKMRVWVILLMVLMVSVPLYCLVPFLWPFVVSFVLFNFFYFYLGGSQLIAIVGLQIEPKNFKR